MSLLLVAVSERHAVIASDGLAIKVDENGSSLVPLQNDFCKFVVVGNGSIVVGSTGSLLKTQKIQEFVTEFSARHRDDPQLFSLLEFAIPEEIRRLDKQYPVLAEGWPTFPEIGTWAVRALLVGMDGTQMRIITWNDLVPDESRAEELPFLASGYSDAAKFVLENEKVTEDASLSPNQVAKELARLIEQAKQAFPQFVGGRTYTHVILKQQEKKLFESTHEVEEVVAR